MTIYTFGSGSSGNCYSLTDKKGRSLILDAGINTREVFRKIMPDTIEAVLVTHSHGDHAKYASNFTDMFVKVRMDLHAMELYKFGDYTVMPIQLVHDAPCLGYVINHPELDGKPILYATDTNGIPYDFEDLSLAMIEADYDVKILKNNLSNGLIEKSRAKRVNASHQSIVQAIDFIQHQVKSVQHILLVHLSADNANRSDFKKRMESATGIPTDIAIAGLSFNINSF